MESSEHLEMWVSYSGGRYAEKIQIRGTSALENTEGLGKKRSTEVRLKTRRGEEGGGGGETNQVISPGNTALVAQQLLACLNFITTF